MNHWLEDMYRDHRRGLFGLALSVVREPASAEDAVHEAFVRMAKQPGPPTGDRTAYVYRAVRNAAIDQVRRRKARPTPTEPGATLFVAPESSEPLTRIETSETQAMLMRAMNNLPDDQRETVVMRSFAGLSFKQIAEATGQPLSTIASRYQRALATLRQVMEKHHAQA